MALRVWHVTELTAGTSGPASQAALGPGCLCWTFPLRTEPFACEPSAPEMSGLSCCRVLCNSDRPFPSQSLLFSLVKHMQRKTSRLEVCDLVARGTFAW